MLLTPLVFIFSVAFTQWSPSQALAHPDMSSEVSFQNDILEFVADDVQPLGESSFTASPRLISYTWFPPPSQNVVGFNISVDISSCSRGVKSYTMAGIIYPLKRDYSGPRHHERYPRRSQGHETGGT